MATVAAVDGEQIPDRVVEVGAEAVQKLRGRLVSVTESKLESLKNTPHLTLGEFRVMVDVGVL